MAPSNRRKVCLNIEHARYENNYEHLLMKIIMSTSLSHDLVVYAKAHVVFIEQ